MQPCLSRQLANGDQETAAALSFAEHEQFMEYEIDEQVSSGQQTMRGSLRAPPRSQMAQPSSQGSRLRQTGNAQSAFAQVQLTTLSQHNLIEIPPSQQTQTLQTALPTQS